MYFGTYYRNISDNGTLKLPREICPKENHEWILEEEDGILFMRAVSGRGDSTAPVYAEDDRILTLLDRFLQYSEGRSGGMPVEAAVIGTGDGAEIFSRKDYEEISDEAAEELGDIVKLFL